MCTQSQEFIDPNGTRRSKVTQCAFSPNDSALFSKCATANSHIDIHIDSHYVFNRFWKKPTNCWNRNVHFEIPDLHQFGITSVTTDSEFPSAFPLNIIYIPLFLGLKLSLLLDSCKQLLWYLNGG